MSDTMMTVYVSWGNSDNKLTQERWAALCEAVYTRCLQQATAIHGEWYSVPTSRWQNAAMCIEISPPSASSLRMKLVDLAGEYDQESIAWAEVIGTDFLGSPIR